MYITTLSEKASNQQGVLNRYPQRTVRTALQLTCIHLPGTWCIPLFSHPFHQRVGSISTHLDWCDDTANVEDVTLWEMKNVG